jgi:hypothetical protein
LEPAACHAYSTWEQRYLQDKQHCLLNTRTPSSSSSSTNVEFIFVSVYVDSVGCGPNIQLVVRYALYIFNVSPHRFPLSLTYLIRLSPAPHTHYRKIFQNDWQEFYRSEKLESISCLYTFTRHTHTHILKGIHTSYTSSIHIYLVKMNSFRIRNRCSICRNAIAWVNTYSTYTKLLCLDKSTNTHIYTNRARFSKNCTNMIVANSRYFYLLAFHLHEFWPI